VQTLIDSSRTVPEHFYQYVITTSKTLISGTAQTKVYRISDMPKVVYGRVGPAISEITSSSSTDVSLAIMELPYKLVNPHAFKYSGNGRFNSSLVFATYKDDNLLLKVNNNSLANINIFSIKAILEDPEALSSFDVDTMDYPISRQGFDFIKDAVLSADIKVFLASDSDTVNDSSDK
jgi:hypothetical protein